ncbi:MAG TPA: CHAT domain-containing protein [Saprospiraceae bacterium]|nr:CHAT domain-containing protein [Saprospiraceae bacterium]HPI05829.1 CHAT domain-containing protein [Saprospiraceae bacterium]
MEYKLSFLTILFLILFCSSVKSQNETAPTNSTRIAKDTLAADSFFVEMKNLIQQRKWEEAENIGTRARNIYVDILGAGNKKESDVLYRMGFIKYYQGDLENAMSIWNESLSIRLKILGQRSLDVANCYNNLAAAADAKGEGSKSIEYNQKSFDIRIDILGPEHLEVANSYNNFGNYYHAIGEYDKSIENHLKALGIRIKLLGPNHPDVASSYDNMGNTLSIKGDYDQALQYQLTSLEIRVKSLGPGDYYVASSYNNLGVTYEKMSQYDKAITFHLKCLDVLQKILGMDHPNLANSYNNLGVCYEFKSEFEKAILYHFKALEIRKKMFGDNHPYVAVSYGNLGKTYGSMEDFKNAIYYQTKSLDIWKSLYGEYHPNVASCYNNLAFSYFLLKDSISKVIELHQNALNIRLKVLGLKHPDIALSYSNLANAYAYNREYDKSIEYYKKAIVASGYEGEGFENVNSYQRLIADLNSISHYLRYLYIENKSQHYIADSYNYCIKALSANAYQQNTIMEENTLSYLHAINFRTFEQAIAVSLLKSQVFSSDSLRYNTLSYVEKSKSSILQSQLKEAGAKYFSGIPDSLLELEYHLRSSITWREKQRQSLLDQGLPETDTTVLRISSIIFDLRSQYETLKNTFESRYPDYYRLKYDLSTTSLDYVQDTLLQNNQTLLEYFVGDSAIYIFTVRPDTFNVTEVKKDFPLEDWVKHLRHGLYDYYQSKSTDPVYYDSTAGEYTKAAYQIYNKLIAPVAGLLTDNLVVVPDGVLGYVPFEALLTKQPAVPRRFYSHTYFGKERRISYAYSATLLREMRDKRHKNEPSGSLLALAPFSRDDVKALREQLDTLSELIALRSDTLPVLRNSGREALVAEKIFKGNALLGPDATKDTFQQLAGNYRILHLSTHGKANDKIGDYAYLGFGLHGNTGGFDKFYVKDIYNLSLNADLVVLSACETGIGQLQRGEGIISLARAFAYAGAKSIVTTLWQVDDARTSRLMQGFYKNLYKGMPKDEALWHVKRDEFMESKTDAHPFFWAGFIPIGDMRPIKN